MNIDKTVVRTDRFSLSAFSFGTGSRSLIVLPGMSVTDVSESAGAVAESYADFTGRYTVTVLDRETVLPDGTTTEQMAQDAAEAMNVLGIGEADLFGVSQGGMMALCLAASHPEKVRRLALGSTALSSTALSGRVFARWETLARAGNREELNRDIAQTVYSPEYRNTYADAFRAAETAGTPEQIARYAVLAHAGRTFDFRARVGQIRCPVLVLGGTRDEVFGADAAPELAQALGCECVLFDGSHECYDELPAFRERLKAWAEEMP